MSHSTLFIGVAQQQGFSAGAASSALAAVVDMLLERGGPVPASFFIYRVGTGEADVTSGGAGGGSGRVRTLLAFRSADSALVFSQRVGLGAAPRLLSLSLAQLLAVLIQRPTIGTLIFADEIDATLGSSSLPPGLRLERSALLALLGKV
jgi:hypothetical protein